jgi:hypothetical protein
MQRLRSHLVRGAAVLGASALLASTSAAQLDVAICAAAQSSSSDCRFTDVQAKLVGSGFFTSVTIINAATSTPTLQQLSAYDAVIVWSNISFQNPTLFGDTLADYVDAGGGVVVAVFANATASTTLSIQGRWQTGYEVILDQSGQYSASPASLGTVLLPGHPIMAGVSTFSGGTSSFRPTVTTLVPNAISIAEWSDGRVLVAQGLNPKRVDLGFYPPSNACSSGFWDQTTDGAKLLSNALKHAATGGGACTGGPTVYCTTSTTTAGCNPAMAASGTPSASASSGFTLSCTGVEGQRSGLIFYGISGPNASPWATGSTSTLCVKAPTQRTVVQSSGGTLLACDGQFAIDFLAYMAANPGALGQPIAPGQVFHTQAWFRDPPAPKTTNLSDGLTFSLCP